MMPIQNEDVLLLYALVTLLGGGAIIIFANLFAPQYTFGGGISSISYYSLFPYGALFIVGGALLLVSLLLPVLFMLLKLYKKVKKHFS